MLCVLIHLLCVLAREHLWQASVCAVCEFVTCVCFVTIPANDIGDEGVMALTPALTHLKQLTNLDLGGEC